MNIIMNKTTTKSHVRTNPELSRLQKSENDLHLGSKTITQMKKRNEKVAQKQLNLLDVVCSNFW